MTRNVRLKNGYDTKGRPKKKKITEKKWKKSKKKLKKKTEKPNLENETKNYKI